MPTAILISTWIVWLSIIAEMCQAVLHSIAG